MLRIFHGPQSRSVRVVWLAEEIGAPYEAVIKAHGAPAPEGFAEASPLGQLPAMTDGDARMIESIAMMQYILAKHGPSPLEVKPDEKDFAPYLQFLHFGEASILAIGSPMVQTTFRAPEGQRENWTTAYIRDGLRARLGVISDRLKGRDYLAGDRFTAADISVSFALSCYTYYSLADQIEPHVQAYLDRVFARPAYKIATARVTAPAP
jgi:glutathione S-transferase